MNEAAQVRTWPANEMSPLCRIGDTVSCNSAVTRASHRKQKCESRVCATTLFMQLPVPGTITHRCTADGINGYGTQALEKVSQTDSEQETKRFTVMPDNSTMIQWASKSCTSDTTRVPNIFINNKLHGAQ
ncbi:hypothetical protein TRVL_07785 [Trypanosoma vivax]|nr:hypothetical protein TRVL_07785 [Trypanosoma vivax]